VVVVVVVATDKVLITVGFTACSVQLLLHCEYCCYSLVVVAVVMLVMVMVILAKLAIAGPITIEESLEAKY